MDEADCISIFEEKLMARDILSKSKIQNIWDETRRSTDADFAQVKQEPYPEADDIWHGVFAEGLDDTYPKKGGS